MMHALPRARPSSARRWSPRSRAPGRGVTLVEALVALAVMAFGMLALVGVQRTIAINSDISRQVGEASRVTASEMAALRSYVSVDNVPVTGLGPGAAAAWRSSWNSLVSVPPADVALPAGTSDTTFSRQTVVSQVEYAPAGLAAGVEAPRLKATAVTTAWNDRSGDRRELSALGLYAAIDTALSTRVVMATRTTPAMQRGGRNVAIPRGATDLDPDTSAYKPFANPAGQVWIFNRDTGMVVRVCSGVGVAQSAINQAAINAASCADAARAFVVLGTVRFDQRPAAGGILSPEAARDPQGLALALDTVQPLELVVTVPDNNIAAAPSCFAGAPYAVAGGANTSAVDYACLVATTADGGWSGRLEIRPAVGWTIGGATGTHRVCRYTALASDQGANALHPYNYVRVRTNLINQNYLVILNTNRCPADTAIALPAAGAALGDYVDTNTRPHQPWP